MIGRSEGGFADDENFADVCTHTSENADVCARTRICI